ncbi:pyridoxal phosphate-dependent transferase [Gamsiella multidivaricata]|uniref:pyridoxal phosphate-dependent transferase n=1 Tax=Gamsiella multidivaricata TaxID=101098 RepID=UPI00221F0F59|nr:pyridoxal phosphate-dependent transferase [Gamsiella multidivaricata]KAI7820306.1 pyridoxal phosphate-dependent transferase [Gamsiella multidivaricata]
MAATHKWNFGAGPAMIPRPVLERAQAEFLDYENSGLSLMELSHRSSTYENLNNKAQDQLRELLSIPSNYKIVFMQGGGHTQFAAAVYNLLGWRHHQNKKANKGPENWREIPVDYIISGAWSAKAAEEAKRLGANVRVVCDAKKALGGYTGIPDESTWKTSDPQGEFRTQDRDTSNTPAYLYYCDNETVNGVEFPFVPSKHDPSVPLVCDMSSNILSRPVDVSKFGVIYAGAQKNIGPAGVSVVIVREDLLQTSELADGVAPVPLMLDYKTMVKNNSLYNTPPMFAIYISSLVFDWLLDPQAQRVQDGQYFSKELKGIEAAAARNERKAAKLYKALEDSRLYRIVVKDVAARSKMNVPFRISKAPKSDPNAVPDKAEDEKIEADFVAQAEARGLLQLAGHRSVGGIRASIYNAMTEEGVDVLIAFLKEFEQQH